MPVNKVAPNSFYILFHPPVAIAARRLRFRVEVFLVDRKQLRVMANFQSLGSFYHSLPPVSAEFPAPRFCLPVDNKTLSP